MNVVFGAGLVVRAHVRYLLDHGFEVTVASRTVSKAEDIIDGHPKGTPMAFDISKQGDELEGIIAAHDVAVSLLPWQYHPDVARACLNTGKHMVTTSYVKEEMQALDAEAKEKGIILLNELGVDPGIDPNGFEIANMQWLGLFGSDPLPEGPEAPVDILTERMLDKMSYNEGERDMLVLQHTFVAEFPDKTENITSTMIDFGIPGGDSSMNRTVGLPAAVGVRFILEGRFTQPGVIVPVMPEFYEPALEELENLGIQFFEKVEIV